MIDVLFLAWNRLAFTEASLAALAANTDWSRVQRLWCYDDGSTDGTREILDGALSKIPVPTILRAERLGSPVAIMNRYLREPEAGEVFAKIDSDILVPPGWLETMLALLDLNPGVELLGMEAGQTNNPADDPPPYRVEPATHIGGVGLMRTSAFRCRPAMSADGRDGFTLWQHRYEPARGWITPDLPVLQLDRLPFEPWVSLSAGYVERGWQRNWTKYPEHLAWAWQWLHDTPALVTA